MQALEEAYEFYDLKKRDRDSRQERLKQLEGNRKAIAEIEKIIENQNESWKDFEVFAERLLGFTMERYGRNLNTEQRRQYFAKEKKLLRAMCENPDTHKSRPITRFITCSRRPSSVSRRRRHSGGANVEARLRVILKSFRISLRQ